MSNVDQDKKYYEEKLRNTQEFFSAKDQREAEHFAEQIKSAEDRANATRIIQADRSMRLRSQGEFRSDAKAWGRDDLAAIEKPVFEVGEKVTADFPITPLASENSVVFETDRAAKSGNTAPEQVEVSAVVSLSKDEYAKAFLDYGDEPQAFLKGHSGSSADGFQKAVVVQVESNEPFIVVPNEAGQAQRVGLNPQPSAQLSQSNPQVEHRVREASDQSLTDQPRLTEAGFKPVLAEPVTQASDGPKNSPAASPAISDSGPKHTSGHNSWGADGISERWSKFESAQHDLKRNIGMQADQVSRLRDDMKAYTKDNEALEAQREAFLGRTKGKTNAEIAQDPELVKLGKQFQEYDKKLVDMKKGIVREEKSMAKKQDQYAIEHCKFHSDSWARVRIAGEAMGNKSMIDKANSMQHDYKQQLKEIQGRQSSESLGVDEPKVERLSEKSPEQAPEQNQRFDSLSTEQYIQNEITNADAKGEAMIKGGTTLDSSARSRMAGFSTQAKEVRKELSESKDKDEKKALGR